MFDCFENNLVTKTNKLNESRYKLSVIERKKLHDLSVELSQLEGVIFR